MSRYISCAADLFDRFEGHRIASGRWDSSYQYKLVAFDKYCASGWPDATELDQAMMDGWFRKRPTETHNTCRTRVCVVASCLKYLHERKICEGIRIPELPRWTRRQSAPHSFTEDELAKFFRACDNIPSGKSLASRLRKLQIPVIFRLLLSSGMRTIEVRMLRREDVDLETGVVNIRKSKGPDQHYAVLDDYMLEIMRKYDTAVSRPSLFPDREYFFPSRKDKPYSRLWLLRNFRRLWKGFQSRAVPYDFRHCYATLNINKWIGYGLEFNARFVYLSRSMGHNSLKSTKYYYSLVPALADLMYGLTNDSFNEIIPEVDYENG